VDLVASGDLAGTERHSQHGHGEVVALFRRACRGGEPEACWSLGTLFLEGIGVPKNDVEAAKRLALSRTGGVLGPRSAWRKEIVPRPREAPSRCRPPPPAVHTKTSRGE